MKNKRGVSPLLAAVLLIAFSIVLAAIVSNFVIKKTKEFKPEVIAEESVYCDSVSLGYKINTDDSAYELDNSVQGVTLIKGILLLNKGTFSVYQLLINTPGVQPVQIKLDTPIIPQSPGYPIKLQMGSSPEIRIIPIIKDSDTGNFVKCPNKELTIKLLGLAGGNAEEIVTFIETNAEINTEETKVQAMILGVSESAIKEAQAQNIVDANSNGITDTIEIGVVTQVIEATSTVQAIPLGNEASPK